MPLTLSTADHTHLTALAAKDSDAAPLSRVDRSRWERTARFATAEDRALIGDALNPPADRPRPSPRVAAAIASRTARI